MSFRSHRRALLRAVSYLCVAALIAGALSIAGIVSTATRASADAKLPWWWNGKVCDTGRYAHSHPLGASYLGVQVCGPAPFAVNGGNSLAMVEEGPDPAHVFGEGEWQCVELAMRFMALIYGVRPYGANGDSVVDNYSTADGGGLVKYRNGTPGIAPQPGDVISFTDTISVGHVGVVAASAVDKNGNGSITMLSQNDTDDGWHTLAVAKLARRGFHPPHRGSVVARSARTRRRERVGARRDRGATRRWLLGRGSDRQDPRRRAVLR